MLTFARTDTGKERKNNQDYYYISDDGCINILADGMGGYAGGEIASKMATLSAKDYITEHFDKNLEYEKEEILEIIKNAMQYANLQVHQKAQEKPGLELMGTTLEICIIYKEKMFIGHVGDSSIFRIRQGIIRKLTKDDSYVQKLVEDGTITKEEARNHPKKNMLVKALGCETELEVNVFYKKFLDNDVILICSDGLTNMVSEEQIYNIISNDINKATENLIKEANNNGGLDNITVIIIKNNII